MGGRGVEAGGCKRDQRRKQGAGKNGLHRTTKKSIE